MSSNANSSEQAKRKQYDKFGFLVAAYSDKTIDGGSPSDLQKRSSFEFSITTLDGKESRMDGQDRKRRNFSPEMEGFTGNRSNNRNDYVDCRPDNWDATFNHPQPATDIGAPSDSTYMIDPMNTPYPVTNAYGQFTPAQYANFLDIPPPSLVPVANTMNIPPLHQPVPQQLMVPSWGQPQPPPQPLLMPAADDPLKREAIASEMRNQRATLANQKDGYVQKAKVLKRELESLKAQRTELRGDSRRSPSPDSQRFLKENAKLQAEIQNKLKTMNNVIDMLNGIIGEKSTSLEPKEKSKGRKPAKSNSSSQSDSSSRSSSVENDKHSSTRSKHKSRSIPRSDSSDKKFNYVYYDPEMHWCRLCNEFPSSAKEYLNHLHTPHHHKAAAVHMEAPWHKGPNVNEGMPNYPGAPTKRTPIKGLQFFVPSTAWYCKLCDQWIGDLHCASAHLKSLLHSQNYTNFAELNPHWEMDWMSDRQKYFEKNRKQADAAPPPAPAPPPVTSVSATVSNPIAVPPEEQYAPHTISFQADGIHTKRKKTEPPSEEAKAAVNPKQSKRKNDKKKKAKKRKQQSSSESSDSSDSSDSSVEKKKSKNDKDIKKSGHRATPVGGSGERERGSDDRMLSQWMSSQDSTLTDHDRKILEDLKIRVKSRAGEKSEQRVDGRVVSREREARELLNIRAEKERESKKLEKRWDSEKKARNNYEDVNKMKPFQKVPPLESRDFKPYSSVRREREKEQDANETHFDKQVVEKSKKPPTTGIQIDSKKMPFIGKMPLYKSLTVKPLPAKVEVEKLAMHNFMENYEIAKKKRDEINAQIQKSVTEFKEKLKTSLTTGTDKDKIQLPAPGLVHPVALSSNLSAASAAPPPSPLPNMTSSSQFSSNAVLKAPPLKNIIPIKTFPQTIHRISSAYEAMETPPPPVIGSNTSIVGASLQAKRGGKPQAAGSSSGKSDALHKDFQDALDIIFPSENVQKNEQDNRNIPNQQDNNYIPVDANMHMMPQHMPPPNMMGGFPNVQGPMPPGFPHPFMAPNMMDPNMGPNMMGPNMGPNMMGPNMDPNMGPSMMGHNMDPNMGPRMMGPNMGHNMGPNHMGMMPPGSMMGFSNYAGGIYPPGEMCDMPLQSEKSLNNQPAKIKKKKATQEMEDMAMLGIDAEDVGASGF